MFLQKQLNVEIIKALFQSSQTEILPDTEVQPTYLWIFSTTASEKI